MVLSTHEVVGSLVASAVSKLPVLGFVLAVMSHFALDAIPHWDYNLASKRESGSNPLNNDISLSRAFVFDLGKISLDVAIGFVVIFFLHATFGLSLSALVWGALGGVLPDFLQFLYFKIRREPLISIQRFHIWIHAKKSLKDQPLWGITSQILIVAGFVFLRFGLGY